MSAPAGWGAGTPEPSAGARRALVVANDTYDHASLTQLRAPEADAKALAEVLGDPEVGGFDVTVVRNAVSHEVQAHIEDLFADSRPDDLLLLHFSGHGLKSDSGELFFAARNTRPDRLGSTSVAADFVQRCMRSARARSIVLLLDCCYGGAFGEGVAVRAGGPVDVTESFPAGRLGGGRGRAVISASSALEYAFEGTTLTADHEPQPSLFTAAVVAGLSTGEADRDEDGLVALSELYDFVFDRVREQNPHQTPGRDVEMSGEVYLARSRRRRVRPVAISDALRSALANPDPTYRRGAVLELRDRLAHEDLGVALGALEALREVARSDTRSVADDAAAVIAAAAPAVVPAVLDFGVIPPGSRVSVGRELRVTGLPLSREVRVEAEPPLSAVVEGDTVTVSLAPTGRPYAGSLTVVAATGSVVVPVTAGAASPPRAQVAGAGTTATAYGGDEDPARVPTAPGFVDVGGPGGSPDAEPPETPADAPEEGVAAVSSPTLTERRLTPTAPPTTPEPRATTGDGAPLAPDLTGAPPATATGAADDSPGDRTPARAARHLRMTALLLGLGAVMVLVGMGSWLVSQDAERTAAILVGPGARAALALTAGLLLVAPRVSPPVAHAFLIGTAAVNAVGAVSALQIPFADGGTWNLSWGWWSAIFGQTAIAFVGLAALAVAAWRSPQARGPISWRAPRTIAVVGCAAVAAGLSVVYSTTRSEDGAGMGATVDILWAVAVVALSLLALVLRPAAAGRALLLAVGIAIASHGFSEWIFRTTTGTIPVVVPPIALAGLALLAASSVGRRGSGTASPAR